MTGQKIGFPQGRLCDPILSQAYLEHPKRYSKDAFIEPHTHRCRYIINFLTLLLPLNLITPFTQWGQFDHNNLNLQNTIVLTKRFFVR